jgi:hypothetical protein
MNIQEYNINKKNKSILILMTKKFILIKDINFFRMNCFAENYIINKLDVPKKSQRKWFLPRQPKFREPK